MRLGHHERGTSFSEERDRILYVVDSLIREAKARDAYRPAG